LFSFALILFFIGYLVKDLGGWLPPFFICLLANKAKRLNRLSLLHK
jgi:hypothetical protein